MVFFSCDGCGDMLKKNQVDNHAHRCRQGCESVSCVDCSVSFYGDDYRAHTSCISEVERYEKRVPTKKNGKVSPQEQWMNLIQASVDFAPGNLKHYLEIMAGLDNVPRKEKQFRNFTINSLNLSRNAESIVSEIWTFLKELREKQLAERAAIDEKEKEAAMKKKEESKRETPVPECRATPKGKKSSSVGKKAVKKAMKKALKRSKDKSLSIKDLRKAVQEYLGASKADVKELVEKNMKGEKKRSFVLDGKIVTLKAPS